MCDSYFGLYWYTWFALGAVAGSLWATVVIISGNGKHEKRKKM